MEINILALGDRFSAAYTSLGDALNKQGKVFYHSEHDFKNVDDAINFLRNSSFNLVVMPNPYGNKRRKFIYKKLKELKFPVVVFDRGALPDSWFFDIGFNADSPSYHPLEWDIQLSEIQNDKVSQYIEELKIEHKALEKQNMPIGSDVLREELNLGDKKILFVPFQRPEDTVIKYFSSGYNNFIKEIENVTKYVKKYLDDEWIVLAKKHPLETVNPSKSITFVDEDINIYDLIDLSDRIVLINSGVGVLSMLWNKPVLYFGQVFYGHPDINVKVNNYKDILYYMNKDMVVNELTVKKFIYHLRYKIYSFANFETEEILQKNGNYRNVTRYMDFYELRFPKLETIIKKKFFL